MKLTMEARRLGGTGVNAALRASVWEAGQGEARGWVGTKAPCVRRLRVQEAYGAHRLPRASAQAALPGGELSLCLCQAASMGWLPNSALTPDPHDTPPRPPRKRGSGVVGGRSRGWLSTPLAPVSVFSLFFVLGVKPM